jgi:hypothetical protein
MRATGLAICIPLIFGVTAAAVGQVSTAFSVGAGYFSNMDLTVHWFPAASS